MPFNSTSDAFALHPDIIASYGPSYPQSARGLGHLLSIRWGGRRRVRARPRRRGAAARGPARLPHDPARGRAGRGRDDERVAVRGRGHSPRHALLLGRIRGVRVPAVAVRRGEKRPRRRRDGGAVRRVDARVAAGADARVPRRVLRRRAGADRRRREGREESRRGTAAGVGRLGGGPPKRSRTARAGRAVRGRDRRRRRERRGRAVRRDAADGPADVARGGHAVRGRGREKKRACFRARHHRQ
ncbi:uncharacterized protein MICPUCDRAFT_69774 [Micromonas pusilla CCMP1545]|uniref:Predicted protein n=1 Tax=Micromonas pusilla (strain CCMP1545) TaxID=564608 RepID=C1MV97_MICPC|nr:uncharacterized protein MICPUCDRAFT_69774 [Micromonas pusilla CCMP1545]EEH56467.1 predicted protein [Micromonas pusilla CCMP1545]|eukprot:XP_003059335.1 predicted protein [Micromonas pusilla CCMP1545]